jgi:DNA-directed RNA polymerase subunit M/transcription elongation factor TFIIS
MVGQRAKCGACGTVFKVETRPGGEASSSAAANAAASKVADEPEYIGFECRLCGTRMYARPKDVGTKVKCPDCHARTEVPPPPAPKKKNIPAAMEGEQYEVWGADEHALAKEIVARQPKFIAVTCRRCGTTMYPTEKQVGETITCPDCDTSHVVPPPAKPKPKRQVLSRDAETPILDPRAAPGDRPAFVANPAARMGFEEREDAEYERALEKSRRTGKPMEIDTRGRPIMPRFPLLTGVFSFAASPGLLPLWLFISCGAMASLLLLIYGVDTAMQGGFAAVAGMCFFVIGGVLTLVCVAAASAVFLQVIVESSMGGRTIQAWPRPGDWAGSLLAVAVAVMISVMANFAVALFPEVNVDSLAVAVLLSSGPFFLFPIVILSQLYIDSPWGVLSPRVLASFGRCPFSWLLFYAEAAALFAICGVASWYVGKSDPRFLAFLTPLFFATLLVYARLIGRLAWRLADATSERTNSK